MPKLFSSKWIIKVLEESGFVLVSQKGSHAKFRKTEAGKVKTVIVPTPKKGTPYGTFRSILRQSGLTEESFEK